MRAVLVLFLVAMAGLTAAPAAQAAPPTAVMTAPASANLGATVRLAGGQSFDDGTIATYRWRIDGGVVIGTSSSFIDVDNLTVGRHTVTLVVVDNAGELSPPVSQDVVVIDGTPPTAILRAPPQIVEGGAAVLNAGESTDAGGQVVQYRFTIDGQTQVRSDPALSVSGLALGAHSISLVVVDDAGNQSAPVLATVNVVARGVAILDAPTRLSTTATSLVVRADRSTSGLRLVRYQWTIGSETFATPDPTLTRPRPAVGRTRVTLVVVDEQGNESQPASADVIVADDERPTAVLSAPASVASGATIKLTAGNSFDTGGRIASYRWTVGSRAPVETSTPGFTAPGFTSGPVAVKLVVVDDAGNESLPASATVGILPKEPVIGTFTKSVVLIAPVGKRVGQISRKGRTLLAGRIFSPAEAKVSATFSLRRSGRTIPLAKRTISVDAGGVVRLNTKLSAKAIRELSGVRSTKLRLRLTIRTPGVAKPEVTTRDVRFAVTG